MMAKYDLAEFAAINARAYREYMARHPESRINLTREQLEAICRDLDDYASAATELAQLRRVLEIERGQVAGEIESLRYALGDIRDDADNGWVDCVTGAADASSYEAEAFERIRRTATIALADGFLNTPAPYEAEGR